MNLDRPSWRELHEPYCTSSETFLCCKIDVTEGNPVGLSVSSTITKYHILLLFHEQWKLGHWIQLHALNRINPSIPVRLAIQIYVNISCIHVHVGENIDGWIYISP